MDDTAPLLRNEPPSYRDATTLQFDRVEDEEYNRDLPIAPPVREELGHQMEITYTDFSTTNVIMSITPLIGVADEIGAYLRPRVDTTLQVRADGGRSTLSCFSRYDGRKMTIRNLIQDRIGPATRFVERCSFIYPEYVPGVTCIDLLDPDSDARVGWIIAGRDIAHEAKIGLDSDPAPSPRFTTWTNTEDKIMIRNPTGHTFLATGKVTRSSTYCGIKTYKGIRIILPPVNSNQVSDAERTMIFAVLIIWALNLQNYKKDDDNCSGAKLRTAAAIAVLLFIAFLGILLYVITI